jgi:hypothetical protein
MKQKIIRLVIVPPTARQLGMNAAMKKRLVPEPTLVLNNLTS